MMISNYFFLAATLLLSLNFIRPFGMAISDWFYFASMGFAFFETLLVERQNLSCWTKNRFLIPSVLILLGAVLSLTRAMQIDVAIIEIFQHLYVVTVFISLIWVMFQRRITNWILAAFILSGLFTALVALLDYLTGSRLGPLLSGAPNVQYWYRYAGTLGHPNKFGYFLVITSLLTLAYLRKPDNRLFMKSVLIVSIFVQLFAIYLSGSVTAFIGIVVGLFLSFIFSRTFWMNFIKLIIPITLLGVTIYLLLSINGIKTSNNTYSSSENNVMLSLERVKNTTAGLRMMVYLQAFEDIRHSPIIGVGYDQTGASGISVYDRYLDYSVHNGLLQVFYTGGIFAFLGWAIIYFLAGLYAVRIIVHRERQTSVLAVGIAASTVAVLIMDQFQGSIYQRETWLIIGLCAAYTWTKNGLQYNKKMRR